MLCRCNVTSLLFKPAETAVVLSGLFSMQKSRLMFVGSTAAFKVDWQRLHENAFPSPQQDEGKTGLGERGAGGHRDGRVEEPVHKLMTVSWIKIIQIHNPR